jgi:hypothetical protein
MQSPSVRVSRCVRLGLEVNGGPKAAVHVKRAPTCMRGRSATPISATLAIHAGHTVFLHPLHLPEAALRRCLRRALHDWPHFNDAQGRARGWNLFRDGDGFAEIFYLD